MPCRATQDGRVIVESSDKTWPTRGGNGKPLQHSYHENPMNSMKRLKHMTLKDEPPRSESVQFATGEEWRIITNSSRKNEADGWKWKWCSVLDVPSIESKIQCYKEQYCIGTWNVRYMSQGKLDTVKQEMVRVNINILGINDLKWMKMGKFNSDDHYIYYCGQESHRRNGVVLIINERV